MGTMVQYVLHEIREGLSRDLLGASNGVEPLASAARPAPKSHLVNSARIGKAPQNPNLYIPLPTTV